MMVGGIILTQWVWEDCLVNLVANEPVKNAVAEDMKKDFFLQQWLVMNFQ